MRGWLFAFGAWGVTFFGASLDFFRSPLNVWLLSLFAAACTSVLYIAWCFWRASRGAKQSDEKFHSATITQIKPTESQRRLELIHKAREFVLRACKKDGAGTDFREKLSAYAPYYDLRPYLSEDFQTKWNAPRTIHVFAVDTNLPDIAVFFLKELDRLEREWGASEP
jgi:hypothetical protein